MAIGQSRSIKEGFDSVVAKIKLNPFQFFLAIFLVMCVGATKKVRVRARARRGSSARR